MFGLIFLLVALAGLVVLAVLRLSYLAAPKGRYCVNDPHVDWLKRAQDTRESGSNGYVSHQVWSKSRPTLLQSPGRSAAGEPQPVPAQGPEAPETGRNAATGCEAYLPRILVVEDSVPHQKLCMAMLAYLGCHSTVAGGGHSALDLHKLQKFDLILMDCQLPDMDGFQTTVRIRQREKQMQLLGEGRRTPIVAVTGHETPEDRRHCLAAGMDDHLAKPYRLEDLAAVLGKWIAKPEKSSAGYRSGGGCCARHDPPSQPPCRQASDRCRPPEARTVIDLAAVRAIRALEPSAPNLLASLIDRFLAESRQQLFRIRRALLDATLEELRSIAHVLKSTSALLGARRLAELCQDLESCAGDVTVFAAEGIVDQVEAELDLVWSVLSEIRHEEHDKPAARSGRNV